MTDFKIAILHIDYDEFNQDTYRGVDVTIAENKIVFATGDVVADYIAAWNHVCDLDCDEIFLSSSVDNFLIDGDKYRWDEKLNCITVNEPE